MWVLLVAASLAVNWLRLDEVAVSWAVENARSTFQNDLDYRHWVAQQGGVYVPVTESLKPNPLLAGVAGRDVTTTTGRRLTLVNPAYMTRLIHDRPQTETGVRVHITSLKLLRAGNAPDAWEAAALREFEAGRQEIVTVERSGGAPQLRFMRPLVATRACLKCHAQQGYAEGQVRGGLSVTVPMAPYLAIAGREKQDALIVHAVIGLLGLLGMFIAGRLLKRSREALRRTEAERKMLQAELWQAQKMEALGTLAGGVAHDFNNILGGVLGGLSLLENELGDAASAPQREYLREMKALVKRGAELTRELLGVARRGKYDVRPVDLAQAAQATATLFGRTRRDVTLEFDFPAALDAALVDYRQFEQILLNLLVNAGQAMPDGGRITLRAANVTLDAAAAAQKGVKPGRYVTLVVADTGCGMDAATQARVFEPFFTTKPPGQGTGLGLASAYGILKNHGGCISVESAPGRGAVFTLCFPATDPVGETEAAPAAAPAHVAGGTILVIDDDVHVLRTCAQMLRRLGYETLTAASGREGIWLVRTHHERLSLVILDLVMPEMSGAAAYHEIRGLAPELKVLIASGFSNEGQAQELLARGCVGFLQKPFDLEQLAAKLNAVL
jgi:signal transduction histidine kinase